MAEGMTEEDKAMREELERAQYRERMAVLNASAEQVLRFDAGCCRQSEWPACDSDSRRCACVSRSGGRLSLPAVAVSSELVSHL